MRRNKKKNIPDEHSINDQIIANTTGIYVIRKRKGVRSFLGRTISIGVYNMPMAIYARYIIYLILTYPKIDR